MYFSSFIFPLDTQLLVRCNLRSRETRQLVIIIATIIGCLLVGLFLLLDNGESENSAYVTNQHHEKSHEYYQNVKKRQISRENVNFVRKKRQANIDPVAMSLDDLNVRKKRLIEELHSVKMQFEQCRNSQSDKNECDRFFRKMIVVSEALQKEIQTIREMSHHFPNHDESEHQNIDMFGKIPESPAHVGHPLHEFNREDSDLQRVREFTPFPRFHEELNDGRVSLWNIDAASKIEQQDMANPPFPPPGMPTSSQHPHHHQISASPRENDKLTPLKNNNFGKSNFEVVFFLAGHFFPYNSIRFAESSDPSGQILQLCDQINRQGPRSDPPPPPPQVNNLPGPTSSGFVTNNVQPSHNFAPSFAPPAVAQPQPQQFAGIWADQ